MSTPAGRISVRLILVRPAQPRNVGAAVRAAANFGAEGLAVVVDPARPWTPDDAREARVASSGAWERYAEPSFHRTFDEAAEGCHLLAATSARTRGASAGMLTQEEPSAFFRRASGLVGVVFGPETNGLTAAEFDRCHTALLIPTSPSFASLNLAQAVLLVAYEARNAAERDEVENDHPTSGTDAVPARPESVEALLARARPHLDDAAINRVRRLLSRAAATDEDVAALHRLIEATK